MPRLHTDELDVKFSDEKLVDRCMEGLEIINYLGLKIWHLVYDFGFVYCQNYLILFPQAYVPICLWTFICDVALTVSIDSFVLSCLDYCNSILCLHCLTGSAMCSLSLCSQHPPRIAVTNLMYSKLCWLFFQLEFNLKLLSLYTRCFMV